MYVCYICIFPSLLWADNVIKSVKTIYGYRFEKSQKVI